MASLLVMSLVLALPVVPVGFVPNGAHPTTEVHALVARAATHERPTASSRDDARIRRLIDAMLARDAGGVYIDAMNRLAEIGLSAVPALETLLDADDRFHRQAAAGVLRQIDEYAPSDRFWAVCVEGLGHDDVSALEVSRRTPGYLTWNARECMEFLALRADHAAKHLRAALESPDRQQRFLSAVVIVAARLGEGSQKSVAILAEHLRDNDIRGDAAFARAALRGSPAAVMLTDHRAGADPQSAGEIDRLLADLKGATTGRSPVSPGIGSAGDVFEHRIDALERLSTCLMIWGEMAPTLDAGQAERGGARPGGSSIGPSARP